MCHFCDGYIMSITENWGRILSSVANNFLLPRWSRSEEPASFIASFMIFVDVDENYQPPAMLELFSYMSTEVGKQPSIYL